MNKLTFVFFGLLLAIIVIVFSILIYLRLTTPKQNQDTPHPLPTQLPIPTLPTEPQIESSGVVIKNPYLGAEDYTSRGDALTVKTNDYHIVYLSQFDEFLITILTEPFEPNRKKAEAEFLSRLGINKEKACSLKVTVSPPNIKGQLNPKYPLSFCDK